MWRRVTFSIKPSGLIIKPQVHKVKKKAFGHYEATTSLWCIIYHTAKKERSTTMKMCVAVCTADDVKLHHRLLSQRREIANHRRLKCILKLSSNSVIWFQLQQRFSFLSYMKCLSTAVEEFTNNKSFFFLPSITETNTSNCFLCCENRGHGLQVSRSCRRVRRCCIVVICAGMLLATATCWPAAAMQSEHALYELTMWCKHIYSAAHLHT